MFIHFSSFFYPCSTRVPRSWARHLPTAFSRSCRFCSRSCLVSADSVSMRRTSLQMDSLRHGCDLDITWCLSSNRFATSSSSRRNAPMSSKSRWFCAACCRNFLGGAASKINTVCELHCRTGNQTNTPQDGPQSCNVLCVRSGDLLHRSHFCRELIPLLLCIVRQDLGEHGNMCAFT